MRLVNVPNPGYEIPSGAKIELPDLRKLSLVCEASTQSAAEQVVDGELVALPSIRGAARGANQRRMIEHDEMTVDLRDFSRREIVLAAGDADVLFASHENVSAHGQIFQIVGQRVFRAPP
jgi:hypothetical protein